MKSLIILTFSLAIPSDLAFAIGIENSPYYASIETLGKHVCSGAIISPNVILTTASCLYNVESVDINVRVGSDQLETDGSAKPVKKLILHKRYMTTRKDYDIALIILENALSFTEYIRSVDLPEVSTSSANSIKPGTHGLLTGFGLGEGHFTDELRQEDIEMSVPIKCKNAYAPLFIYITERMFCAELSTKHSCHGDAGSPLIIDNVLVGIQAWEHKCGNSKFPGIYTHIANLRKWIRTEANI